MRELIMLRCVIRRQDGGEETTLSGGEIAGSGEAYLCSLGKELATMQTRVNARLTELVEREKAAKKGADTTTTPDIPSDDDTIEGAF